MPDVRNPLTPNTGDSRATFLNSVMVALRHANVTQEEFADYVALAREHLASETTQAVPDVHRVSQRQDPARMEAASRLGGAAFTQSEQPFLRNVTGRLDAATPPPAQPQSTQRQDHALLTTADRPVPSLTDTLHQQSTHGDVPVLIYCGLWHKEADSPVHCDWHGSARVPREDWEAGTLRHACPKCGSVLKDKTSHFMYANGAADVDLPEEMAALSADLKYLMYAFGPDTLQRAFTEAINILAGKTHELYARERVDV